ncbi:Ctr copper transporter [Trema orientale]|uniref:Copper transport protein n=2 Tax=Cannabaceae TaxID=3481 RepID=A0A2P5DIN3_PARAD|nr:Ctr copper transporter [Trema orientale]PON73120.1 Ctr copper transporter [Parasponia andersonii]
MMHMTFYWSKEVTLLFDTWRTSTWTGYALTLVACLIVSAFYQYLEDLRLRIKIASAGKPSSPPAEIDAVTPFLQKKLVGGGGKWSLARLAGALLFGVNSAIGYLLMLAIMSFNGGVFVAVVLGLTIGCFVFRTADDDVTLVVDNPCACA